MSWNSVISHGFSFINFTPKFHLICASFADITKFSISLDLFSSHFLTFSGGKKLSREMVMGNCEIVMEKPWKVFYSIELSCQCVQ